MRAITILVITFTLIAQLNAQDSPSVINQVIKAGKSKNIKTLIHITGGQLNLLNGNEDLAHVDFSYDKNIWNPTVSYAETDDLGKLIIKASTEGKEKQIDDDNKCNITLNDKYNYSLGLVLGAGLADLNLENFHIEKALFKLGVGSFNINLANTSIPYLKIEAGIGEATVDLSGEYKNDLKAQIDAGIGELKIIVPENTGVRFLINGFLGNVHAASFTKNGDEYTNNLVGKTRHTLMIKVNGAIGTIYIKQK